MAGKIIIADDYEMCRKSIINNLKMFCEDEGIEVEFDEASDGKELVEKVLSNDYQLVFTDNQMTEVHGLKAIKQIREQNKLIPIYMVSSSEVGNQAMELGATGYIEKDDDDITHKFEELVKKYLK